MKSNKTVKTFALAFLFSSSFLFLSTINAQSKSSYETNVEVTIDKDTTDDDFIGIQEMLKDHDIEANFDNIQRNENGEITGISITLSTVTGQQTSTSLSSNMPISPMEFGSKNGNLFVGRNRDGLNMFALFNNNNFSVPFDTDSIFGSRMNMFKMDDFFNNSDMFFFNGDSMDMDSLRKKLLNSFKFGSNPSSRNFSFLTDENKQSSRFRFVDDPNKETVIVIDGKVSDFKTLDQLAKEDKLSDVDVLKPSTAISIYGNKAKDGAIIATTKE
ncbi:hypothetical protein DFQ05_0196 [Winogradskyella wandonensis]|uniref:TonB-dependent receptor-like protein n=1 Tax=Winogradskyella wandonensis TaxID=1442586 RepID=A0A4R1KU09_9FLAO|nr:hypothetical protein [Winogradskyella wandonensis]TCK68686.1 hypothetical protein DFQ05_0196 [Winogradskyella wandonensis]